MNPRTFFAILSALFWSVQAGYAVPNFPRATTSPYSNKTAAAKVTATSGSQSSTITPACCFVLQDTVSENWWEETSYSSTYDVVNLTSVTTYYTVYPNRTSTKIHTNIYTTNASFLFSYLVGVDPITDFTNVAPQPTEVQNYLNGTVPVVVTGGVTIHSPAAFYEYNSVKIITVPHVTDKNSNRVCGTPSAFTKIPATGFVGDPANTLSVPTFSGINSYAEAYYGGLGIVGININNQYTDKDGHVVHQTSKPSAVVISLTTPFIYAPERGAKGETGDGRQCLQTGGTENYGYVPQTVLDYLVANQYYSAKYPGLEFCLPGGPSILQEQDCQSIAPDYQTAGGDLTSSTVIYVTPPGVETPAPSEGTPPASETQPAAGEPSSTTTTASGQGIQPPASQVSSVPPVAVPESQSSTTSDPPPPVSDPPPTPTSPSSTFTPPPPVSDPPSTSTSTLSTSVPPLPAAQTTSAGPPLGSIINFIIGGGPPTTSTQSQVQPQPVTIPAPTTIPAASAPPGVKGSTTTINNTPFIIIPSPTTISASQQQSPAAEGQFSTTTISGSPFVVIPGSTVIPASLAPSGLTGVTTTTNNIPYLIITSPTTVAVTGTGSGQAGPSYVQVSAAEGCGREGRGQMMGLVLGAMGIFALVLG